MLKPDPKWTTPRVSSFKQDYRVDDRVESPLGPGVIINMAWNEKLEGTIIATVKHDTVIDEDGDTFDFTPLSLRHI